jgi:hypothetical protein
MVMGQSRAEEDQGIVVPVICAAGVPTVEMACRVDLGTSVLEGSNIMANWATDIGSAVGRGGHDKAGEAADVLSAIAGSGGGSGTVASAWGGRQWQSPEPLPPPLPAPWASLPRDTMVRLLLSLLPSLLVGW